MNLCSSSLCEHGKPLSYLKVAATAPTTSFSNTTIANGFVFSSSSLKRQRWKCRTGCVSMQLVAYNTLM